MYLSSLYGPVYLVSHIVAVYMMPDLRLIIALELSRKSGFQTAAVQVTTQCCFSFFANEIDIKMLIIVLKPEVFTSLMCRWKIEI